MKNFLFVFFSVLAFTGIKYGYHYWIDTSCDDFAVSKKVNDIYSNLDTNPFKGELDDFLNDSIKKGFIEEENREKLTLAYFEHIHRAQNNCQISPELKELVGSLGNPSTGDKDCPEGMFTNHANNQYSELSKSPEYPKIEEFFKTQFLSGTRPEKIKVFEKRWDEEIGFKESVIKAAIQSTLRENNNCKNPSLPITNAIVDLAKEKQ
ncbi:MAG: hypothetical protein AAGB32_00885 [Pseudomonadota bacterium]